jgi:DNA mismatch repair protein MutS
MHDLERLVSRVSLGTAGPRDLVSLEQSLGLVPDLVAIASGFKAPLIGSLAAEIDPLADVREAIAATIVPEPPALARDGGVIRDGVDSELDGLRTVSRGGKAAIAEMEAAERVRTGVGSLKVRYNRVFGYYIEISKSNLGAVPADYIRKQTVAGGERVRRFERGRPGAVRAAAHALRTAPPPAAGYTPAARDHSTVFARPSRNAVEGAQPSTLFARAASR